MSRILLGITFLTVVQWMVGEGEGGGPVWMRGGVGRKGMYGAGGGRRGREKREVGRVERGEVARGG